VVVELLTSATFVVTDIASFPDVKVTLANSSDSLFPVLVFINFILLLSDKVKS